MALESFYGGKQGVSPVIKAKFDSRENLANAFKNSGYKDVWFSELAIIDSPNKLNPDNGKLYRRTLATTTAVDSDNYAGPNAEYIGQIVGPAGGIPNVILTSLSDLNSKAHGEENSNVDVNNGDQILYPTSSSTVSSELLEESTDTIYISEGITQQVPGRDGSGNYNDNVRYSWFNLVKPATADSDDNQTAYVYLGFEIPYPTFEFSTEILNYNKKPIIEENSQTKHPYHWNYKLSVPRGIRGIWQEINLGKIEDFYDIETQNWLNPNTIIYHSINDLIYDESSDSYNVPSNSETAALEDFKNGTVFKDKSTQFWYLKVQCPELSENTNNYDVIIKTYYFYLEDFKVLSTVNLDDGTGVITLTYNNGDTIDVSNTYTYISGLYLTPNDKALAVSFNGAIPDFQKEPYKNKIKPETIGTTTQYYVLDRYNSFEATQKFYWNVIKEVYTDYQKNAFYILFTSNIFESINDDQNPRPQNPQPKQTFTNKYGNWTYQPNPDNAEQRWWYTISPITQTKRGVRILTALNFDNYTFKDEYGQVISKEDVSEKNIIDALNDKNGDNWIENNNPYNDGADGQGGLMEGEFGVYNGFAFYWDELNETWACIGSWEDSASSSHEIYLEEGSNEDEYKSSNYSVGMLFSSDLSNNILNAFDWPKLDI